jgi:hypothetical protein
VSTTDDTTDETAIRRLMGSPIAETRFDPRVGGHIYEGRTASVSRRDQRAASSVG